MNLQDLETPRDTPIIFFNWFRVIKDDVNLEAIQTPFEFARYIFFQLPSHDMIITHLDISINGEPIETVIKTIEQFNELIYQYSEDGIEDELLVILRLDIDDATYTRHTNFTIYEVLCDADADEDDDDDDYSPVITAIWS